MMEEIGNVKGVKSTISMSSLLGPTIPESMIPENLRSMLQSDEYELAFVSSEYESATDEVNEQVKAIDKIVKSYDKDGMVIGEAPLMKDLQDVTDADLVNVNVLSIGAIFIIILLIFKSISLPIILVAVIEFAIMLNMAIPYYLGNQPSIRGQHRNRSDSARCNRGLRDPDDNPLSERSARMEKTKKKLSVLRIRPVCRPSSAVA